MPTPWTSGASPAHDPDPRDDTPPPARGTTIDPAALDRGALADAGPAVVRAVRAVRAGTPPQDGGEVAARTAVVAVAVAATGALAARLPDLSGVDGAVAFDEPQDELLHAYAGVLARRAGARAAADEDDLLAVAHLAAAAAAVDAAAEPALLLLGGVTPADQLRATALLLAQTAEDGAAPLEHLAAEVDRLFGAPGRARPPGAGRSP